MRARLLNIAKAERSDFNQVLVRYALERLLYRLSRKRLPITVFTESAIHSKVVPTIF